MAQFLFLYLFPSVMYWVTRQARITERGLTAVYALFGLFALYLCGTAIAETHGWWSFVFPAYLRSPEHVEFFGRGRGPVLNPAGNGFYQGATIAAGLMLWPRLGRRGQLALLATTPVLAWGVYATLTRSAWMGVSLSALIVIGLSLPRAWRAPVIGSFAIVATITLAVSWQSLLVFKRDKNLSANESLESAKLRPILARIAWNMFLDRPLFGAGFGQYQPESKAYLHDRDTDLNLEKGRPYIQHNVFLSQLTELGLMGMFLWIGALALWGVEAWRLWSDRALPLAFRQCGLWMLATLGAYLPNGMFQDVGAIPMFNAMVLFVAGLTTGLAAKTTIAGPAVRQDFTAPAREDARPLPLAS
jgi:O-antigen ligase